MNFSFHPSAEDEADEVAVYYGNRRPGLGAEFLEEVYATITRILKYPRAWPRTSAGCRSCIMTRFPYAVVYKIASGDMIIYAVAHLSREPGYWKSRLEDEE